VILALSKGVLGRWTLLQAALLVLPLRDEDIVAHPV